MPKQRPNAPDPVVETSSRPVLIPEEQQSLFREVLELLESRSIPFAVAGAFALREHTGITRETKDLDAFITPENAALAIDHLRENGFHCEVTDPVWLFKVHRDNFFVDLITGMSNSVIVVDDSWIRRAKPAVVQGVQTRILAAEELLVSKLFVTYRERFDGADIAHIIYRTEGKLDWQRVRELTGEHWELLLWALIFFRFAYPARTEFVPRKVWADLIGRLQHAISHPDPSAPFRGSLLDNKMFAVDVNDWDLDNLLDGRRAQRLRDLGAPPDKSDRKTA